MRDKAGKTAPGLLLLVAGIVALGSFVAVIDCLLQHEDEPALEPQAKSPAPVSFHVTRFSALPGWGADDLAGVAEAFLRSCRPPSGVEADAPWWAARPFGGGSWKGPGGKPVAGTNADWAEVCAAVAALPPRTSDIQHYFEEAFTPVRVTAAPEGEGTRAPDTGLFTGYYEPQMTGSVNPRGPASVALLEKPADLVSIDLGDFRDGLKGKRLAGRVVGGALKPYEDRAAIEAGGLGDAAKPLVWIDDPVDAFFLHIQGSGRVMLEDGSVLRVGYAGQNGHPYVAIGKVLVEQGAMSLAEVSMQSIRTWLTSHPDEAGDIMRANTSYVFFHRLNVRDPNLGPLGAGGTNLTPWRSLAVDRTYHALGVPVWLDTDLPPDTAYTDNSLAPLPLQRLMIAQDTGGAITGPVRGDIFFGWGEEATDLAGRMKQDGRMTLLLPNPLARRLVDAVAVP